jgi:hypothetical protein
MDLLAASTAMRTQTGKGVATGLAAESVEYTVPVGITANIPGHKQ